MKSFEVKNTSKKNILRIMLIALIAATLAFIFVQSALPPTVSKAESDKVADVVGGVVSPDTGIGGFFKKHIRDIAHFCEYGLLGAEISISVACFTEKRRRNALFSLMLGQLVGFLDETVQIFSGRVADIADVWVDFFGFVSFTALTYLSLWVIHSIRKKGRKNTAEE